MRKVKLSVVINSLQTFKSLLNKKFKNWNIVIRLTKASKDLDSLFNMYTEQVRKLLDEYAIKEDNGNYKTDTNGNFIFSDVEKATAWNQEVIALQNTEVEIFDKIVIEPNDFKSVDDILTPAELMSLEEFIEISLEEPKHES